jgi:hypothetical protein
MARKNFAPSPCESLELLPRLDGARTDGDTLPDGTQPPAHEIGLDHSPRIGYRPYRAPALTKRRASVPRPQVYAASLIAGNSNAGASSAPNQIRSSCSVSDAFGRGSPLDQSGSARWARRISFASSLSGHDRYVWSATNDCTASATPAMPSSPASDRPEEQISHDQKPHRMTTA